MTYSMWQNNYSQVTSASLYGLMVSWLKHSIRDKDKVWIQEWLSLAQADLATNLVKYPNCHQPTNAEFPGWLHASRRSTTWSQIHYTGLHLNWTMQKFTITRVKTYKGYNFAFLAKSVLASTSIQGYTCNMQVIY